MRTKNKDVAKIIANTLREIIKSRGINQKWLADRAETTEPTISRYLKGATQPEINIVMRVAKALDVSMDYLCGLTNLPEPKESLGLENYILIRCYERSDSRDKKIIWSVLEGYMTSEEKENPFSSGIDVPIS